MVGPIEKSEFFPHGFQMYDEMRTVVWDDDMVALLERYKALEAENKALWEIIDEMKAAANDRAIARTRKIFQMIYALPDRRSVGD